MAKSSIAGITTKNHHVLVLDVFLNERDGLRVDVLTLVFRVVRYAGKVDDGKRRPGAANCQQIDRSLTNAGSGPGQLGGKRFDLGADVCEIYCLRSTRPRPTADEGVGGRTRNLLQAKDDRNTGGDISSTGKLHSRQSFEYRRFPRALRTRYNDTRYGNLVIAVQEVAEVL